MLRRTGRVLLASAVATAALLVPAQPGQAAGTWDATLTCDTTTNTIRATASGASGTWRPGWPLTVTFQVTGGSYATTTGTAEQIPYASEVVTVPVTAGKTGAWSTNGYTRAWKADDYAFYTETVRITVYSGGQWYGARDKTCTHETRTTANFACDPATNTIDVSASGVRYGAGSNIQVNYYVAETVQAIADEPGFTTVTPGSPRRSVTVPVSADGTWSDPAFARTSPDYYYGAMDIQIEVTQRNSWGLPFVVGRTGGVCVYADRRPQPAPAA